MRRPRPHPLGDVDNRDRILEIYSFESTHDPENKTTLRQYIERMKNGQDSIYYITGNSRSKVENSPHIEAFRDKGLEMRLSSRLSTSPACVVGDNNDMGPTLEKMYRARGHEVPRVKRILEVNPNHSLVSGMRDAYGKNGESQELAETAELVHGMALLAEGGELREPSQFTSLLANRLAQTL